MSYIINKTDGSVLTEVVDGTVDQVTTDLTLIGKNSSSYGEFFNENLIHLLENFANTNQPNNPIAGQLWYDTTEQRLKVYDGNGFKVSGGTVVSTSIPSTLAQGDIWIDSFRQQLYFNDGSSTILAGPSYTAQQGITGFSTIDVIDTNQLSHTIILLYVAQVLLGIFSKDSFTPGTPITGFTGTIEPGFNVSTANSVKFRVPVTQADSLLSADNTLKTAESFLSTTDNSTTTGTVSIQNTTPLILGPGGAAGAAELKLLNLTFQINSQAYGQNFQINSLSPGGQRTSLHVDSTNQWVGIYTEAPTATLDVNGDARVRGNLTVEGSLTTVNTTNLEIKDKLIELGKTAFPDNVSANSGGISLAGGVDGDKTLIWELSTDAWTSSEHFNLLTGKNYYINGDQVLSRTVLGTTVINSSLTTVGVLTGLQVANSGTSKGLIIDGSTVSFISSTLADGDIVLEPKGDGFVDVSAARISNLATPTENSDATTKLYVDSEIRSMPLALGDINISDGGGGQIANTAIADIIATVYPPAEHENSTICRVQCIIPQLGSLVITRVPKRYILQAGVWTFDTNI
jgi:hypothetical protein